MRSLQRSSATRRLIIKEEHHLAELLMRLRHNYLVDVSLIKVNKDNNNVSSSKYALTCLYRYLRQSKVLWRNK